MYVTHLGDCVADAFVESAFADGTTGDVDDGNVHHQSGTCRGEHLEAVAEDYEQVGTQFGKGFSHAFCALCHRRCRCCRPFRICVDRHAARYGQSCVDDFMDGVAEFRRQVHVGSHNLEHDVAASVERFSDAAEQPPVGACAGDYANFSHISISSS